MTNFLDYEGLTTYNEELLGRHIPTIYKYAGMSQFYITKTDAELLENNSIILINLNGVLSISASSSTQIYQYDTIDVCTGGASNAAYLGTVMFASTGQKRYGLLIRTGDTTWIMI